MPFDKPDLIRRAFAAWYRTGGTEQPASAEVPTVDGLTYVRLVGEGGVLAIYRVQSSARLKRLRRFPKALRFG
jgi:hypothetical protein